jgi:hypothetical protein
MSVSILECKSCRSPNVIELVTETCLHFPGLKGLNAEPIFVFPGTVVCLDCGFMWSHLAWREIEQVRKALSDLYGVPFTSTGVPIERSRKIQY